MNKKVALFPTVSQKNDSDETIDTKSTRSSLSFHRNSLQPQKNDSDETIDTKSTRSNLSLRWDLGGNFSPPVQSKSGTTLQPQKNDSDETIDTKSTRSFLSLKRDSGEDASGASGRRSRSSLRSFNRLANSSEDNKSVLSRLPVLTVTPSPSVHFNLSLAGSLNVPSGGSSSNPSLFSRNLSISPSTYSTIPSVSSVSLHLVEQVQKLKFNFKDPARGVGVLLAVMGLYFFPLLYGSMDPLGAYFYIMYGLFSLGIPALYFYFKPKNLKTVMKDFSFC